jgi:hypothetical protein
MTQPIKPVCNASKKCLFDAVHYSYLGGLVLGTNSNNTHETRKQLEKLIMGAMSICHVKI